MGIPSARELIAKHTPGFLQPPTQSIGSGPSGSAPPPGFRQAPAPGIVQAPAAPAPAPVAAPAPAPAPVATAPESDAPAPAPEPQPHEMPNVAGQVPPTPKLRRGIVNAATAQGY